MIKTKYKNCACSMQESLYEYNNYSLHAYNIYKRHACISLLTVFMVNEEWLAMMSANEDKQTVIISDGTCTKNNQMYVYLIVKHSRLE